MLRVTFCARAPAARTRTMTSAGTCLAKRILAPGEWEFNAIGATSPTQVRLESHRRGGLTGALVRFRQPRREPPPKMRALNHRPITGRSLVLAGGCAGQRMRDRGTLDLSSVAVGGCRGGGPEGPFGSRHGSVLTQIRLGMAR